MSDRFPPEQMNDADLRKTVMRRSATDYLRRIGGETDRPGSLARMLEEAFRAGVAAASTPGFTSSSRRSRRMIDDDLPPLTRSVLRELRASLFGTGGFPEVDFRTAKPARAASLIAFRYEVEPRLRRYEKDEWIFVGIDGRRASVNWKPFGPLIKAGIYAEFPMGDGWSNVLMTEWGYEFLKTGATSMPNVRQPGGSTTYGEFAERAADHDPREAAAYFLGVRELPEATESSSPRR